MTVARFTAPPVFAALVTTRSPSAATSAIGKPTLGEIRYVLEAGIGEVRSGHLCAAFEQMPAHGPLRQQVEIVLAPAMHVQQRPERQRRIGAAADEHDMRTGGQRLRNRAGTQVGVGGDDGALAERDALHDRLRSHFGFTHGGEQIVAGDGGDLQAGDPQLARQRVHPLRRAQRVGRAHVGDDADAVAVTVGQHQRQVSVEEGRVSLCGILALEALRDRERALGEHLVDQEALAVELRQRRHHRHRGVEAVAGEAGAATDVDLGHQ